MIIIVIIITPERGVIRVT